MKERSLGHDAERNLDILVFAHIHVIVAVLSLNPTYPSLQSLIVKSTTTSIRGNVDMAASFRPGLLVVDMQEDFCPPVGL
jgi:hypothetical protein